ncbi:AraC family transcriptional regulator [Marinobacteraceae bacterium S3BR75-40.1]
MTRADHASHLTPLLQELGSNASLSASYILSLLPVLEHWGIDAQALLAQAGMNPEQLRQPGARVSFFHALRLYSLCQMQVDDPLLAIVLGQHVRPRSFPVLGYAAMSSANLHEAIDRLMRFEKLVWNVGMTGLRQEDGRACLQWSGRTSVPPQFVEGAISGWVHFGRRIVADEGGLLQRVVFSHSAADDPARYAELLGADVQFDQDWNGLELAADRLDTPLLDSDPELRELMDSKGAALLEQYRQRTNLVSEVQALLVNQLRFAEPSLEDVAARLELTPRALVSRLGEQGLTFKALLDEVRKELALAYLEEAQLALVDIAFLLGFSEQSAFNRAFKRWTGQTPGQFRKGLA